jgi:hypothetical protein
MSYQISPHFTPDMVINFARRLNEHGQKISAIALIRSAFDIDLKEAKDFVENDFIRHFRIDDTVYVNGAPYIVLAINNTISGATQLWLRDDVHGSACTVDANHVLTSRGAKL